MSIDRILQTLTWENMLYMLQGAGWSLLMATIALIFGILLGVLGASCKLSKNKFLRFIGNVYVEVIRGTPMLLQIMYLFLVIPQIYMIITGSPLRINVYLIGIIAISINSGAYCTELIRSGIVSIDKGQWEASKTLGLNHSQMMRYVILPQAFKQIVPPLVSEYITLIKDSSLVSVIGGIELLRSAQNLGNRYYAYLITLTLAGVYYLVMTLFISWIARKLERRLAESD